MSFARRLNPFTADCVRPPEAIKTNSITIMPNRFRTFFIANTWVVRMITSFAVHPAGRGRGALWETPNGLSALLIVSKSARRVKLIRLFKINAVFKGREDCR
jgi:hypothetical protein